MAREYCKNCGEETEASKMANSNRTFSAGIAFGDPPCICTRPSGTQLKPQAPPERRPVGLPETIGWNPRPAGDRPTNMAPIPRDK